MIMYKLWNFLFGWDYIHWSNRSGDGIARVSKTPDGKAYYFRSRIGIIIDVIRKKDQVLWLTCLPEKYLKD